MSTLAGRAGEAGFADGALEEARFDRPRGVAVDGREIYVADFGNHRIRCIALPEDASPLLGVPARAGAVTTFAGRGSLGSRDAAGVTAASFSYPWGLAFGPGRVLFVTEHYDDRVRAISPAGSVTTLAKIEVGEEGSSGFFPTGIAVDVDKGVVFVVGSGRGGICRLVPASMPAPAHAHETGGGGGGGGGGSMDVSLGGNEASWTVSALRLSDAEGAAVAASSCITFDPATGSLLCADRRGNCVRAINPRSGQAVTLAGGEAWAAAAADPSGAAGDAPARCFGQPGGIAIDSAAAGHGDGFTVLVADSDNHRVCRLQFKLPGIDFDTPDRRHLGKEAAERVAQEILAAAMQRARRR